MNKVLLKLPCDSGESSRGRTHIEQQPRAEDETVLRFHIRGTLGLFLIPSIVAATVGVARAGAEDSERA